jgi:myosin V
MRIPRRRHCAGALFKPEDTPAEATDPTGRGRATGSAYKFVSVGSQFKKQLAALMATLSSMEPHYVRCIKPNSANSPSIFEKVLVLQQLRCGGVLEAVRISCAGYPSRRLFFDFVEHFWHLAPDMVRSEAPDDDVTMAIVQHFLDSGYAKGRTKIFLKGGQMAVLEKHRTNLLNTSAIMIQKHVRGHLQGGAYRQLRRTVIRMQALARMAAAQRLAQRLRYEKATLTAQTAYRGARARRDYLHKREAILTIQAAVRGKNARAVAEALRQEKASVTIQRYARGAAVRSELRLANARATAVQCLWRRKVARRKLRQLRAEARESGKLLQDKERLESQLKEMQKVVATMQSSRADDRAKLLAVVERAEKAEREAARLGAVAAAAAASNAADLAVERDRLMAENVALEGRARADAAAVQELKTKVCNVARRVQLFLGTLGFAPPLKARVNSLI